MNSDEQAIHRLHDNVMAAFHQFDLEKLLALHTEDMTVMEHHHHPLIGKGEIRPVFTKAFGFFKRSTTLINLDFKIHDVEVSGNRAFARGEVTKITQDREGKPKEEIGKYLCLFKKQSDGNWLRSHVMANNDAPSDTKKFWQN